MLLCPTVEVRQSKIHGLGLFATTRIAAGTLVLGWRAEKDFRITPAEWQALPDNLRRFLYVYCWVGPGGDWYGTHDGARFTNHSRAPNIRWSDELMSSVALRHIEAGEEITEDYEDFDGAFAEYASELAAPAPEPVTFTREEAHAGGHKVIITYDEMRRIGLVGSTRVAVLEWRARLKKRHDDLIDEVKQIERVLAGPDPEEDFE